MHIHQVHYLLEPCADYVKAAVNTVVDLHREDVPGDVLVFLTGQVGRSEGFRKVRGQGWAMPLTGRFHKCCDAGWKKVQLIAYMWHILLIATPQQSSSKQGPALLPMLVLLLGVACLVCRRSARQRWACWRRRGAS